MGIFFSIGSCTGLVGGFYEERNLQRYVYLLGTLSTVWWTAGNFKGLDSWYQREGKKLPSQWVVSVWQHVPSPID